MSFLSCRRTCSYDFSIRFRTDTLGLGHGLAGMVVASDERAAQACTDIFGDAHSVAQDVFGLPSEDEYEWDVWYDKLSNGRPDTLSCCLPGPGGSTGWLKEAFEGEVSYKDISKISNVDPVVKSPHGEWWVGMRTSPHADDLAAGTAPAIEQWIQDAAAKVAG